MNLRRLGLDALHERLADRALDLDAVLRAVVDATREIVAADRATLYLVDQARQELVSRAAHLPEITEIRLQMGQGLAGWVAQTGQRVNLREGRRDPRHAPQFDARTGYSTRTLLAMPLRDAKGHTIGVLQVLNKQGGAFERPMRPSSPSSAWRSPSCSAAAPWAPNCRAATRGPSPSASTASSATPPPCASSPTAR